MPTTTDCFSTLCDPSDELAHQFAGYVIGAISEHLDIVLINEQDGLLKITEEINIAITLLEIAFPDAGYIKYKLVFESDGDEIIFEPSNEYTQRLLGVMESLEY